MSASRNPYDSPVSTGGHLPVRRFSVSVRLLLAVLGVIGAIVTLPFLVVSTMLLVESLVGIGVFDFTLSTSRGSQIKLSNSAVVAVALVGTLATITCFVSAITGGGSDQESSNRTGL